MQILGGGKHVGTRATAVPAEVMALLLLLCQVHARAAQLPAEVELALKSPDAFVSGTYDLPARLAVIEKLLASPLIMAGLWQAYAFNPQYQVRMNGRSIHIDDPTGIEGDIIPVERSPNRYVYYGTGNLNHELVPAFGGRMAIVLTLIPKDAGASCRIDVYIRADSRTLGFLARGLFPLLKDRVVNRMTLNVHDVGSILNDVSTAPEQTAARLKRKEDAAALIALLCPALRPETIAKTKQ